MKARDQERAQQLRERLLEFSAEQHALPGLEDPDRRDVFLRQVVESLHRVEYPGRLLSRDLSPRRADPFHPEFFDPIKGAAYLRSRDQLDEAAWLVFLFVHLGARPAGHWRLLREIYGGLGQAPWTWNLVIQEPQDFAEWVVRHQRHLRRPGAGRGFGNHRKFESLGQMERVVDSYVRWIGREGHLARFRPPREGLTEGLGNERRGRFDALFRSMRVVHRFGRLARFDYLCMLGKLDLADIEPGMTYMQGATGPARGAKHLFFGDPATACEVSQLEALLIELEAALGIGMQALEDAVCNWQKSPGRFKSFRG